MFHIIVNGKELEIPKNASLEYLVLRFTPKPEHVIAEVNGKIVPQMNWETIPLNENDKIELVTFVGGG